MKTVKTYPHGGDRRYIWNRCRCDQCRAAHTAAAARRRRLIAYGQWGGYIDATGTVRRLRALSAIGWSVRHVAQRFEQRTDVDPSWLRSIARGNQGKVHADTARTIAAIYDDWCTQDGPSKHSRSWATKKGWHGPEAWDDGTIDDPSVEAARPEVVDEVAVHRALRGDRTVTLTPAERRATVALLVERGAGTRVLMNVLRCSATTARRLINQHVDDDGEAA